MPAPFNIQELPLVEKGNLKKVEKMVEWICKTQYEPDVRVGDMKSICDGMNRVEFIAEGEEPEMWMLDQETGEALPGQKEYFVFLKKGFREKGGPECFLLDIEDEKMVSMLEKYACELWGRKRGPSFFSVSMLPIVPSTIPSREDLGLPEAGAPFEPLVGMGEYPALGKLPSFKDSPCSPPPPLFGDSLL
eukprot:1110674-Rhodomonas_salina.4